MIIKTSAELDDAANQLNNMKSAQNLDDFEKYWKEFITYIDRSFSLLSLLDKKGGKFASRIGLIKHDRKADALLKYLWHARNDREHAGIGSTAKTMSLTGIRPAYGNSMTITNLRIDRGQISIGSSDVPVEIVFMPEELVLIPVVDRGSTYQPPNSHLGKPIQISNPITVSDLALEYYRNTLADLTKLVERSI